MESVWGIVSVCTPYLVSLLALLVCLEQISYLKKKRNIPGPNLVLPFIGNAISFVLNPKKFWELQSANSKSSDAGFSANYIFGRFILFITSSDLSHKVFANVRPDAFQFVGHPFGKIIFGDHNLGYLFGQQHKDLRRLIAPNFTPRALSNYISIQQIIILKHLKSCIQSTSSTTSTTKLPITLRTLIRDMNLETSQAVFVGPYLNQEAVRQRFNKDFNFINVGLMKLPINFPGFAFRSAKLGFQRILQTLVTCARESRTRMKTAGSEPTSTLDFLMVQQNVREDSSCPHCSSSESDEEIGHLLFDFLLAAQDASTSSLLWAVTLLDSHPEVLARVREEVAGVWSPESDTPITPEQLSKMRFTQAVAKEIVRFRPPGIVMPHVVLENFQLTENYTIPKGTIVFPSIFESSFQGFVEPHRFDPDRFMEERQEDRIYKKNFLVFGTGAHQCVGQRFAINHLVLFIAIFTSLIDFKRHRTDGCDDFVYVPTIIPKDECKVFLSK
ncbi:unnamed protein product, partial [Ilex paraguariensis]